MDKFRKLLCAVVAAAICVCLSGCASDDAGKGTSTTSAAPGSTTTTTSTLPPPANTSTTQKTDMSDSTDGTDDRNDGEYEADENGKVPDESNGPDEAAYAPSYINMAANGLSITKIGWGLGKDKDEKNRPIDAIKAEEKYKDYGARFLTEDGKICLTFDEGYENGYTEKILDTLKEKGVKAIFFVTYDYCRTSPELVRRMILEGHTVGNHTYTHPSMPDCSRTEMTEEVLGLHSYVEQNFNYNMKLFRFPKGEFSENALDVVNKLDYTSVFWSFAYNDWDTSNQPDPAEALKKIKNSTHSGIYLLHAASKTNAEILGDVIDFWQSKGFEVGKTF